MVYYTKGNKQNMVKLLKQIRYLALKTQGQRRDYKATEREPGQTTPNKNKPDRTKDSYLSETER